LTPTIITAWTIATLIAVSPIFAYLYYEERRT
jgi:hypothetical protein